MLTEPASKPGPDRPVDPLDVVVLVVPENVSPAQIIDVIAHAATRDHTAVLVVLPRGTDLQTRRRIEAAGANHCAVAPQSTELFGHMQRARANARRRVHDDPTQDDPPDDDPLDALWRSRSSR